MALTAAPERLEPEPAHLAVQGADGPTVAGHGVVGEMSSHHARQPAPLVGDGLVPAVLELVLDLLELGPQSLRDGMTPKPEAAVLALPTDVGQAQEIERLRLPEAPRCPSPSGKAPELDQSGLVGVQLQTELRKPLTEIVEELPGVTLMLESDDKVIRDERIMSPRACLFLHCRTHRSNT